MFIAHRVILFRICLASLQLVLVQFGGPKKSPSSYFTIMQFILSRPLWSLILFWDGSENLYKGRWWGLIGGNLLAQKTLSLQEFSVFFFLCVCSLLSRAIPSVVSSQSNLCCVFFLIPSTPPNDSVRGQWMSRLYSLTHTLIWAQLFKVSLA